MIITIARQCGSGGLLIGEELAKHYKIPFYTTQHLQEMAHQKGLDEKMADFFEEYPVNSLLFAITQSDNMGHVTEQMRDGLAGLIGKRDCIILGRCGNYIFKDREDCVSVFLKGDHDRRVEFMSAFRSISIDAARELVDKQDDGRRAYHNYYTGQTWGDAQNYDLCIDSNRLGFDHTTRIIISYIDELLRAGAL